MGDTTQMLFTELRKVQMLRSKKKKTSRAINYSADSVSFSIWRRDKAVFTLFYLLPVVLSVTIDQCVNLRQ